MKVSEKRVKDIQNFLCFKKHASDVRFLFVDGLKEYVSHAQVDKCISTFKVREFLIGGESHVDDAIRRFLQLPLDKVGSFLGGEEYLVFTVLVGDYNFLVFNSRG